MNLIKKKSNLVIFFIISILLFSCENDIKEVNLLTNLFDEPNLSSKNIEIIQSDSGLINIKLIAPVLNRYDQKKEPYIEFPEGIEIYFYDKEQQIESQLSADYSKYWEDEGLWEAKYNVIAINKRGETLNTEYLIWDEKKGTIYSDKFVKVTDNNGIIYGEGLEASQDLSRWKILNPKGIINFEE
ncbi:MAG: LPS export ABC transporter periplasmic protein LptC [Bacteroidales bacterium]|nr:LPS export ABC transporter periplasmic protein LptC [Bacteroidales bacterium]